MRIDGVAVVTGGASGIGAACCRELARRGASVVVLDTALEAARNIAREVEGHAYAGDVGDDAGLAQTVAAIEAMLTMLPRRRSTIRAPKTAQAR